MTRIQKRTWIWIIVYAAFAAISIFFYFEERMQLAYFDIKPFVLSNFTLNYLLMMLIWGAAAPTVFFRKQSFWLKWLLTLVGFVLLLIILTIGGLHTRLTDLFGGVK